MNLSEVETCNKPCIAGNSAHTTDTMEEFGNNNEIQTENTPSLPLRAEKLFSALKQVEDCFGMGDSASLDSAEKIVAQLQFLLAEWKGGGDPSQIWFEWAASVATAKGHLERMRCRLEELRSAYELALDTGTRLAWMPE